MHLATWYGCRNEYEISAMCSVFRVFRKRWLYLKFSFWSILIFTLITLRGRKEQTIILKQNDYGMIDYDWN